jgi:hypothetical protein
MSYLNPLRLHFAGTFQANVSTGNNNPANFDNSTFTPSDLKPSNGSWNSDGEGTWRMIGCDVTAATDSVGASVADDDLILHARIADSDRAAPAKLVDLDPMQQMVSEIWGLELRICDCAGTTLVRGTFEPAAFVDIWSRAIGTGEAAGVKQIGHGSDDYNGCAMYQSVLTGVQWGDISSSPFLVALQRAQQGNLLSVKFMVDGYDNTPTSPTFTLGRIVGSVGPASPSEPAHMVRGRQLMPVSAEAALLMNFCVAVLDASTSKILLDLGNALPTTTAGGAIDEIGDISLLVGSDELCTVPYGGPGWYERTASIVALPTDRTLTEAEIAHVQESPLKLRVSKTVVLAEAPLYVRPDQFVFRLNPGESATAKLVATKFGVPLANAPIVSSRYSTAFGPVPASLNVAVPPEAIQFPLRVTTDSEGVATLVVTAQDPGNPRHYIDGQMYGIRAALEDTPMPGPSPSGNQYNFISILVWDTFEADVPPTWHGSLQPIFQLYANLYPIMKRFLDLSSYDSVCENQDVLLLAFGLDPSDSNSMPVTRDLSGSKRAAILAWLGDRDPDGNLRKPLLGTPAADGAVSPVGVAATAPASTGEGAFGESKAAAAARELVNSLRRI